MVKIRNLLILSLILTSQFRSMADPKSVEIIERHTLESILIPHGAPDRYLRVGAKKYKNLIGGYREIKELDCVMFETVGEKSSIIYAHFVNLAGRYDISIPMNKWAIYYGVTIVDVQAKWPTVVINCKSDGNDSGFMNWPRLFTHEFNLETGTDTAVGEVNPKP